MPRHAHCLSCLPASCVFRSDRVTIREREVERKEEEDVERERKRQAELRKKESQKVCHFHPCLSSLCYSLPPSLPPSLGLISWWRQLWLRSCRQEWGAWPLRRW